MGHQRFKKTGRTFLGKPILEPLDPYHVKPNTRIPETRRQLEVLEREALTKRAEVKGAKIRSKTRERDVAPTRRVNNIGGRVTQKDIKK